ncbi:MAG TPA: helix-turn-helix transcriptional regulator [Pseudonocardiaceae bacterium]|nr:helix-turn-helix transcriptional regulator [Pseudonocardiaceae bacterium]
MIVDSVRCSRLLGIELRRIRLEHGWTREELVRLARLDIAMQTLATYELGTRVMPVPRLFDLADALGVLPHDLVSRVYRRLFPADGDLLEIDLRMLAGDQRSELRPAQRWAATRLGAIGWRDHTISLDGTALTLLAQLCDMPLQRLRGALDKLAPPG